MIAGERPWDRRLQTLLALVVAFNILPLVASLPHWITLIVALAVVWKLVYLYRGFALPPRLLLGAAALAAGVGVFFRFGTLVGQDAAGALLVVMAGLKLLETNRYRDAMFVIFTSYFLLMTALLDSQSLAMTVDMVIDVFLITALMYQVHRRDQAGAVSRNILRAIPYRLLALIVPLWIFLFFLFPRFSATLWNMRTPEASSGFSDEVNPGSIHSLIESDDPAFRVEFHGSPGLSPENFYWRGGVLAKGEGLKWSRKPFPEDIASDTASDPKWTRSYEVYLEPGYATWLFALDAPKTLKLSDPIFARYLRKTAGEIYQTTRALNGRVAYEATATDPGPEVLMNQAARAIFLQLPDNIDPRVTALAAKIKQDLFTNAPKGYHAEDRLAHGVMKWFADNGFRYSTSPGALHSTGGSAQLAEFLFEHKVGFCEHYSTSFATLMRAMGVPARVVVGFQGGTRNEYSDYWLIRKIDAHAWDEIWESNPNDPRLGRWVRFDPTGTVAPLRLQIGGDFNRLDPNTIAAGLTNDEIARQLNGGFTKALRHLESAWDFAQMQWNSFLLNYDLSLQTEILARLGVHKGAVFVLLGAIGFGLMAFGLIFAWRLRQQAQPRDALVEQWRRFCASFGLTRSPNEGALAFAERVASLRPELGDRVRALAARFVEARYGAGLSAREERELRRALRRGVPRG